jgi:two-component system KDP operon response regulator KdpE
VTTEADAGAPPERSVIAIVEDDTALRRALRTSLRARGFDVRESATGEQAVVLAADGAVDAMLLDLGLPDLDGLEVLSRIRTFSKVPVIVVTARDRQADKVRALDAGADDYVTKPFDTEELLARVRAVLRRVPIEAPAPAMIRVDDVEIDLARRRVTVAGEPVHLTRTELLLLEVLVTHAGKLLTQQELLRRVWGQGYGTESEYLRVYVAQLRKKLGDAASSPRFILTEPGIGYRWIAEPAD